MRIGHQKKVSPVFVALILTVMAEMAPVLRPETPKNDTKWFEMNTVRLTEPQYKATIGSFFENGTSRIHFEAGFGDRYRKASVDLLTVNIATLAGRGLNIDLQNGNDFLAKNQ